MEFLLDKNKNLMCPTLTTCSPDDVIEAITRLFLWLDPHQELKKQDFVFSGSFHVSNLYVPSFHPTETMNLDKND